MVTGQTIGLSALSADGPDLFWLESRPLEAGRTTLMRRDADGATAELTPAPLHVGNRVHEYGGGAYAVRDGLAVFSHKPDGAVWRADGVEQPRPVASIPGCRYADFRLGFGNTAAFCIREDHRAGGEPEAALVALDLSGQTPPEANEGTALVRGSDFLSSPRLSPDGHRLAWIAWNHPDMPWDGTRLYVAGVDRDDRGMVRIGASRLLAGATPEAITQPDWSPDGVLHFCSDRAGWWNLYRFGAEASRLCPMRAEIGLPHWVFGQRSYAFATDGALTAARIADGEMQPVLLRSRCVEPLPFGLVAEAPLPLPDGGFAFLATPPDQPARIVIARGSARGRLEVAREAGEAALAAGDVSIGQPFLFPAGGGRTGHAFWYPPRNRAHRAPDSALPPLLVNCHGGPTGMAGPAFSIKTQWWTSRGFAVLDVNYRGSTGYGRAHRQALDGQWGVADVADCIAAARHAADAGLADAARMAIRGSSAGGFTALMALSETGLFAAGASHYGVTDLRLLAGDTHKFESRYLDRLVGPLPGAEAAYDARSPIRRAAGIRAPVIFFHGLDDRVVPPAQARGMVAAMRARGIRADLHEFEGEAHGFRRAETIGRVLELETRFYAEVFGLAGIAG